MLIYWHTMICQLISKALMLWKCIATTNSQVGIKISQKMRFSKGKFTKEDIQKNFWMLLGNNSKKILIYLSVFFIW